MKNFVKYLFAIIIAITSVFVIASCDDDKPAAEANKYAVTFNTNGGSNIAGVVVEEGKTVAKPADPTKENYEFGGWYSDEALTVEYDFATAVTANLVLYAGWVEVVTNQILVQSVSVNADILAHQNNKTEKANKKTEFFELTETYKVGDDNPWVAKPAVSFISYNPKTKEVNPVVVNEWKYTVDVFVKDGDNYGTAGEELIDSVDLVNATVDFSELACGKEFKVVVTPDGLTDKQKESLANYQATVLLTVVDGYNAYTAKDLALIENRTDTSQFSAEVAAWNAFKEENGIDLNLQPASLILQKNINVTVEDFPGEFVYHEKDLSPSDSDYSRTLGSLKDFYFIYYHVFSANESFKLEGNYYTLSSAQLPIVTREWGDITPEGEVISHATLFFLSGDTTNECSMENLYLIGNAPRVENNVKAGGIIFIKVRDVLYKAENNIATSWFITYMVEESKVLYSVDKCKCYNNFNSFFYNWGGKNLVVTDSELIGCGGPIIIQDHIDPQGEDKTRSPLSTFTNCVLSSYVVGVEGWFTVVKATAMVPAIKSLDALFNPFGRSFLKNNSDGSLTFMNLICVTKSGTAQSLTGEKVDGSLTLNGKAFNFGKTNPYLSGLLDTTFSLGAPAFESSAAELNDGIAYGTNEGLFDVTQSQILNPANKIFSGDYLSIYFNGMMYTLGYFPAGQIYTAE